MLSKILQQSRARGGDGSVQELQQAVLSIPLMPRAAPQQHQAPLKIRSL